MFGFRNRTKEERSGPGVRVEASELPRYPPASDHPRESFVGPGATGGTHPPQLYEKQAEKQGRFDPGFVPSASLTAMNFLSTATGARKTRYIKGNCRTGWVLPTPLEAHLSFLFGRFLRRLGTAGFSAKSSNYQPAQPGQVRKRDWVSEHSANILSRSRSLGGSTARQYFSIANAHNDRLRAGQ
jgi:hypothetical protein